MLVIVILVLVVGAIGSNIILIETNYVYAQWITPADLSGINQNMHQKTSVATSAHNNHITTITNKRYVCFIELRLDWTLLLRSTI
jgi:hypothetical protein